MQGSQQPRVAARAAVDTLQPFANLGGAAGNAGAGVLRKVKGAISRPMTNADMESMVNSGYLPKSRADMYPEGIPQEMMNDGMNDWDLQRERARFFKPPQDSPPTIGEMLMRLLSKVGGTGVRQ